ncbi:MAG: hypothetical protein HZC42_14435 [Candidatus Eisenbacteria bacterium]|nr:hypothetical protein [Candidatus Eisenbacteria bacterium]
MKARLPITATLLLVAALLSGCGKTNQVSSPVSGPDGSVDQAAVAGAVASSPQVVEDGEFESTEMGTINDGQPGATAAISPLYYWRVIHSVQRSFEFAFADTDSTGRPTTAIVTIHKLLAGSFNILVGEPGTDGTPIDSSVSVLRKPLFDHWVRRLLLKRIMDPASARDAWRVVATSGVKVTSRNAQTRIESLRVQTADLDTTITDPLRFIFLRNILKVDPEAEVTLTVTTLRNDDVVVLQLRNHRRFRFHNNGDNTYTGVWRAPMLAGLRHFGVNALSNGTLFDDEAPYDSQAWLLPYLVRPNEIADTLP